MTDDIEGVNHIKPKVTNDFFENIRNLGKISLI